MAGVGYKGRDPVSHRTYNRKVSIARAIRNSPDGGFNFTYRGTRRGGKIIYGLGHDAGEKWGEAKGIDPMSRVRKYSKNSPSFDEGVYKYKMLKRQEMASRMAG